MTDLELNEVVARKLGWIYSGVGTLWHPPNPPIPERPSAFQLPAYSTSIAAAWEIVPKIAYFTICQVGDFVWKVSWLPDSAYTQVPIVEADTAPKAICLAFLKLP